MFYHKEPALRCFTTNVNGGVKANDRQGNEWPETTLSNVTILEGLRRNEFTTHYRDRLKGGSQVAWMLQAKVVGNSNQTWKQRFSWVRHVLQRTKLRHILEMLFTVGSSSHLILQRGCVMQSGVSTIYSAYLMTWHLINHRKWGCVNNFPWSCSAAISAVYRQSEGQIASVIKEP